MDHRLDELTKSEGKMGGFMAIFSQKEISILPLFPKFSHYSPLCVPYAWPVSFICRLRLATPDLNEITNTNMGNPNQHKGRKAN
jgi:hypothetical protein